ncbi:hypothetical protein [Burkholderia diffusa]|uniref:hypothetical protein n=1 Tax=Burkholderia diffusa TaxID=488732 RepID=UPI00158AA5C6|nr:hypothetical protein [Burkholderia diffusa]
MQGGVQLDGSHPTFEVKLQTFSAGTRRFVNACMAVEENVIGDFDQAVLLGSFQLSVSDLIWRLSMHPCIVFDDGENLDVAFNALYDAAWKGELDAVSRLVGRKCTVHEAKLCVAIPIGVEAFDGESAFSFNVGNCHYFVWREWESKSIKWIRIERTQLIAEFEAALQRLD